MFIVLYRWRVKAEMAEQFVENWTAITRHYLENCGSLGSRLHIDSGGVYHGYAQWPNSLARDKAKLDVRLELARLRMKDAVEETFPETILELIEDHLELPSVSDAARS